jgi:hypothetical protein
MRTAAAAQSQPAPENPSAMKMVELTRVPGSFRLLVDGFGSHLEFSSETDDRVADISDFKIQTKTAQGAVELAREINCWGRFEASALGHAVVFWGAAA